MSWSIAAFRNKAFAVGLRRSVCVNSDLCGHCRQLMGLTLDISRLDCATSTHILTNVRKTEQQWRLSEPAFRLEFAIWVPIPPTAEQRRIVARIDELFTEIADGETALTRARDDLDTWRRSLLKAAVTGELTREWREHNKPNETGEDLLCVSRADRPWLKRQGSAGRTQDGKFEDRRSLDLPDLPDGWCLGPTKRTRGMGRL